MIAVQHTAAAAVPQAHKPACINRISRQGMFLLVNLPVGELTIPEAASARVIQPGTRSATAIHVELPKKERKKGSAKQTDDDISLTNHARIARSFTDTRCVLSGLWQPCHAMPFCSAGGGLASRTSSLLAQSKSRRSIRARAPPGTFCFPKTSTHPLYRLAECQETSNIPCILHSACLRAPFWHMVCFR